MLRIIVDFGFIFILVASDVVHGDFPNYENAGSTQIFPNQTIKYFNQFNASSSYPVSLISQPLARPTLPQSISASATSTQLFTNTDAASGIQPGFYNNGYINFFQSSVVSKDPSSVTSASTTGNIVSASAGSVSTSSGSVPTSSGSVSTSSGSVSTGAGSVSTGAGSVSTSSGSVSTGAGSVPTSSGSVSTGAGSVSAIGNTNGVSRNAYNVISPSVEALGQSFSQSLSSIPIVKNFLEVPFSASEISDIFYEKSIKVLEEYGHPDPYRLATIASQPLKLFDVFTISLLFKSIGESLAKFLLYEGVEITPNISNFFASYIEKYLESYNVSDVDSLIEAVCFGSAHFITGLGFNILEKSDYLAQVFFDEITALKN